MSHFISLETNGSSAATSEFSEHWFGGIQTGYRPFNGYKTAADTIDLGLLRWPGGTISETRPEVYGLDIPGLFDATDLWAHNPDRQRPDLEASMAYAIQEDIPFSLIIPTARYKDDLATGEAHLETFLADLFTGEYGALPANLTLEIGNEFYALDAFADAPGAYGNIASSFTETIHTTAQQHLSPAQQAGLDIAVQMGRSSAENDAVLNAFSTEALSATTALVFHSLPISLNNLNKLHDERDGLTRYDAAAQQFDAWRTAIDEAGGNAEPDLFLSAWSVGGSGGSEDSIWHEYGSKSVAIVLDTFASYASIGTDAAAVWGINSEHNNQVSSPDGNASELSHIGALLALMSTSLPGLAFQGDFTPHSRDDDTMTWTFGDGDQFTSYVAINELGSFAHDYTANFDGVENFQLLSATLITSDFEDGYTGLPSDTDASVHEVPVVDDLQFDFTEDGIQFEFERSYDAAEISISANTGSSGSVGRDWISGTFRDELIDGYAGDDFILGGAGQDTIQGGEGADQIDGGSGNDVIFGDGAVDDAAWAEFLRYTSQTSASAFADHGFERTPHDPIAAEVAMFEVDSFDFDL